MFWCLLLMCSSRILVLLFVIGILFDGISGMLCYVRNCELNRLIVGGGMLCCVYLWLNVVIVSGCVRKNVGFFYIFVSSLLRLFGVGVFVSGKICCLLVMFVSSL